ncbi:transglutaminase-like domain-containing protein [Microbacterium fluvii]|uniref:transglutaminase-like domain-containing protein n=1 Tax=Microbacterium fluvii TaxID=415215 RepID=UPI0031EA2951
MSRTLPVARADRTRIVVVPRIVAGSLYAAVTVAVAAAAAWPIYRTGWFALLVVASAAAAAVIAAVAHRRRWPGWAVVVGVAGAIAVTGVPLAVPSRLGGGPLEVVRGLGDLGAGLVVGWKDLLTVDLPVGTYRNLLVPALVVFLVGTCAALLLSWRDDRVAVAAAPTALAMVAFGLFFGRTSVSEPLTLGPVVLHAPLETAIGATALLSSLLWLAWRSRDERVRALQRAAISSGVRISRRASPTDRRRGMLAAGMIAVALVVAVAVVPYAASGADREVLRSSIGPDVDLSAEVSPLASYRALFADDRADEVLFTVSAQGALPDRVRIATLDSYDGQTYRSGGSAAVDQARFVRVPSTLDAGEGEPIDLTVSIEGLDGVWMPTAGQLESVAFSGGRSSALADGFYYSAAAAAGVQTAGGGLQTGDRFEVSAVVPATQDLRALSAPGGVSDAVSAPDSLIAWVDAHRSGSGGAALAGLVDLLRERGYLSHALTEGETTPAWAADLPGYTFQPSASGHSLARIDAMFTRLLEREADSRAVDTGNYVAAVGDVEQFAVAVALIAGRLGFPARVVLGARLSSSDPSLPTCDAGECRAQDAAVWTEVRGTDGTWVPIDVTPQFAQSPSLERTEQRDPENVTDVIPDAVEEVVPPEPLQDDTASAADDDAADGWNLAWLWPILRVAGIVLLLLALAFGPFLVVIVAKAARRGRRRRDGSPAARLAGGWDEYVDAAIDARREAPRAATRGELAAAFDTPAGGALAVAADRAVFSHDAVDEAEAVRYWELVDAERRMLAGQNGFWRRLRAAVSLRSFIRHLAPPVASTRLSERGKRRSAQTARTT